MLLQSSKAQVQFNSCEWWVSIAIYLKRSTVLVNHETYTAFSLRITAFSSWLSLIVNKNHSMCITPFQCVITVGERLSIITAVHPFCLVGWQYFLLITFPSFVSVSRFLLEALEDLDSSLKKLNSRLFVIRGQPTDVFPRLFKVCNPAHHKSFLSVTVKNLNHAPKVPDQRIYIVQRYNFWN